MTATDPVRAIVAEMYAEAAALRGSQAVGALRVIRAVDPDYVVPGAPPVDHWCEHGQSVFGLVCAGCNTAQTTRHPADLRTYRNPATRRRSVLCRACGRHPSFHRHTGESA